MSWPPTEVYFARNRLTGSVKIGASYQTPRRLKLLARAVRAPIDLLVTAPGARPLETSFHILFWDLHEGHEWFRASPRIDAVVAAIRSGEFDFTSLPVGRSPVISAGMRAAAERKKLARAA